VAIRNATRVGRPSTAYAVSGVSATQSARKLHPDSTGQAFRSTNGKAGGESWTASATAPPARTSSATSGSQRARSASDPRAVAELEERVRCRPGVARGALHDRQPAGAVEDDGGRREPIDEVAEAARRVRPPRGAPPVRVLLDQAPEPGAVGGAIDDLRAAPVGRGPAADHAALRAEPAEACEVGLPMWLAPTEIVVGGGDTDVEHR